MQRPKVTGPRTPEGKAVSRYNALKHGILAKAVIPKALEPYESRETYEVLLADLRRKRAERVVCEEDLYQAESSMPDIYDALEMSRYETALRNRMEKALSQLERLQRLRGGEFVAAPIGVTVSGGNGE